MIIFENDQEIDIRAIKTFGVNAKDNKESAIGYFGTGLKYAIAILLRNDHEITINTGGKRYKFGVVTSHIRNDDFDIVTMNNEELGFTTDLGRDWEMWMAFRELYSNMLDENGHAFIGELKDVDRRKTTVVVRGEAIEKLYLNRDNYFLNYDRYQPLEAHDELDIYEKTHLGPLGHVFFKGVRVMESQSVALFDYNHKAGLLLTEDRTIKDSWSPLWHIAKLVANSSNESLIKRMVLADPDTYESRIQFRPVTTTNMQVFLDVVGDLRVRYKDMGLNPSAIDLHKRMRKVRHVMPETSCPLSLIEQEQWNKATKFCRETLSMDLSKYKMIVCEDIGKKNCMGLADIDLGIIYISRAAFRKGTKCVATAILEEYTHCHFEVEDETLQQKWVYLDQIIGLGEQLLGEPI